MNLANKTLKEPDEVKKLKHILEEADATVKIKVRNKKLFNKLFRCKSVFLTMIGNHFEFFS